MRLYFLESSALAKLFVQELGSARLIELVEPLTQPQKLISALAGLEVHSAIRRRERTRELTPAHAGEALKILTTELARMTEHPLNASVIETARRLLDRHPLRALDAVQLASCCTIRTVTNVSDIVFVASDELLLTAANAEGFQTVNPAH